MRPEDIVEIANEYVASWDEADLARLPAVALPPKMHHFQDVGAYAVTLARMQLLFVGPAAVAALIDEMYGVFMPASSRIAQLLYLSRARVNA